MNKKCQFIREEILRLSERDSTLFADLFERQLDRTYTWALQDAAEINFEREYWRSEKCLYAVAITIEKMPGYYPKKLGISPNFRSGESWGRGNERDSPSLPSGTLHS